MSEFCFSPGFICCVATTTTGWEIQSSPLSVLLHTLVSKREIPIPGFRPTISLKSRSSRTHSLFADKEDLEIKVRDEWMKRSFKQTGLSSLPLLSSHLSLSSLTDRQLFLFVCYREKSSQKMDSNCNYNACDGKLYLGFDLSTQQVVYLVKNIIESTTRRFSKGRKSLPCNNLFKK